MSTQVAIRKLPRRTSGFCESGRVELAPVEATEVAPSAPAIRIGYAHCSTKDQELDSQMVALRAAGCMRVFAEKISTRVKVRPELDAALALCRDIKSAVSGQTVIFTAHELERPARDATELMAQAGGL